MTYVTIDHEDIYTTTPRATAVGPPLLAIHGSGGTHRDWPEEFQCLENARVYAVDLPGHGRSGGSGRNQVAAYAKIVARLVERLTLEGVILAGHSLGGAIVQMLAIQKPAWLGGIILVGTGARLRVHPDILKKLVSNYETTVDLICDWAFGPEAPPELVNLARRSLLETPATVTHGDYHACNQFDLMEQVGKIRIPTLIVSARADRLTPVKYGKYLQNHIHGSQHVLIEGAGHMMALEKPTAFVAHVNQFIDAKLQPSTP
jgi:pimeloyl-ACP methyl ester carboxylesterase